MLHIYISISIKFIKDWFDLWCDGTVETKQTHTCTYFNNLQTQLCVNVG